MLNFLSVQKSLVALIKVLFPQMRLGTKIMLLAAVLASVFHHSVAPPVTQKPEVENDILVSTAKNLVNTHLNDMCHATRIRNAVYVFSYRKTLVLNINDIYKKLFKL